MKKLDRRIVRTRELLANSLITLALEQGYENLTIRMVTEKAGIGYRTFYRHYLTLDDLLFQLLTNAFQELKQRALQAKTPHGEVLALYQFIRDHPDVLRVYVNLPQQHAARQVIMNEAAQIGYARYDQRNSTRVPLGVSIDHLIMLTNSLVAWYLDHFDEYTPEQAAEIHDDLIIKALERQALILRDDWPQKRCDFLSWTTALTTKD